jgi:dTDP-4-amino-4,6-dideoxygalactose transaminase
MIEQARYLSQQARQPLPHYEHVELGHNYRMSNIVAAIGRGQLRCLTDRVQRKHEIFSYYQESLGGLPGISFMPEADYGLSNRWLTVILVEPGEFGTDNEQIRLALEKENIESRPVWKPMHLQPVFNPEATVSCSKPLIGQKKCYEARWVGGAVSERLYERGLCLPSGTAMREEDLERVVGIIKTLYGSKR